MKRIVRGLLRSHRHSRLLHSVALASQIAHGIMDDLRFCETSDPLIALSRVHRRARIVLQSRGERNL